MQSTACREERWVFVTFGDGDEDLRKAARRITSQALANGAFALAINFDAKLLSSITPKLGVDFEQRSSTERGFGYWRWKPVMVEAVFRHFLSFESDFDGIVYADAGCELPSNHFSKLAFRKVFNATLKSPVVAAQTDFLESNYTKRVVFEHLDPALAYFSEKQMQAGWMAIRKNDQSKVFVEQWMTCANLLDGLLVNDHLDREYPCFESPRNDQSIFSILFKQFGFIPYNFDYYEKFGSVRNSIYPIWTSRNRSGKSVMKRFVNWNLTGMVAYVFHSMLTARTISNKSNPIVAGRIDD
jgi:hypothetical protein